LKQYEGNLETLNNDFENRFEKLKRLKPCFEFLLNPFVIDVINDGCPVVAPFVSDVASLETELIELQKDIGLKLVYKSSSLTDFWKQFQKQMIPIFRKLPSDYSLFLGQLTAVNLSSL
jgi:hypothetical protein